MMTINNFALNNEIIWKAKNYPFDVPNYSYIFINGIFHELIKIDIDSLILSTVRVNGENIELGKYLHSIGIDFLPSLSNRFPVLAYGANASYKKLKEDFSQLTQNNIIPVVKAKLSDFDVVYSAHFSPYSSIPATLQYSPKTIVNTYVTYLTEFQLEHMNKTEKLGINYSFGRLFNIKLVLENNNVLNEVFSYFTKHGCLFLNDSYISLSSVTAENRKFPQMDELEVLKVTRNIFDKNKELDIFITENIKNEDIRKRRIEVLKQNAKEFSYQYLSILKDQNYE